MKTIALVLSSFYLLLVSAVCASPGYMHTTATKSLEENVKLSLDICLDQIDQSNIQDQFETCMTNSVIQYLANSRYTTLISEGFWI